MDLNKEHTKKLVSLNQQQDNKEDRSTIYGNLPKAFNPTQQAINQEYLLTSYPNKDIYLSGRGSYSNSIKTNQFQQNQQQFSQKQQLFRMFSSKVHQSLTNSLKSSKKLINQQLELMPNNRLKTHENLLNNNISPLLPNFRIL